MSPLIPEISDNIFWVKQVQAQTVIFERRSSKQTLGVPLQRVSEILEQGNDELPEVAINGRLQWLTIKREWKFFPVAPADARGVPRDENFYTFAPRLQAAGKQPYSQRIDSPLPHVGETHEVFYDENGYYLRQQRPDGTDILLVEK